MIYSSLAFLISMLACVALCALVRRTAPAIGAVVPPRADRWHSEPTPTMGGVAIAVAAVLGFGVIVGESHAMIPPAAWLPIPLAAIAMFVVDPRRSIPASRSPSSSRRSHRRLPRVFADQKSWHGTAVDAHAGRTIWFAGVATPSTCSTTWWSRRRRGTDRCGIHAWLRTSGSARLSRCCSSPCAGRCLGFCTEPSARAALMASAGPLHRAGLRRIADAGAEERTVFPWTSVLVV